MKAALPEWADHTASTWKRNCTDRCNFAKRSAALICAPVNQGIVVNTSTLAQQDECILRGKFAILRSKIISMRSLAFIFSFLSLCCSAQVIDLGVVEAPDMNRMKFNESDLKSFFSEAFKENKPDSYQYKREDVKSVIIDGSCINGQVHLNSVEFFKYMDPHYKNKRIINVVTKKMENDYADFLVKIGRSVDHEFHYQLGINVKINELVYASITSTDPVTQNNAK